MKSGKNSLVKAGLFIVLCSWLVYTAYWLRKSFSWVQYAYPYRFTIGLVSDVVGTIGLGFRTVAGLVAISAMVSLLIGREVSRVVKLIGVAVVFEAFYFLCFIPSALLGFQSPELLMLVETGIPCLVESIIVPASLLKLRSKLTPSTKSYGGAIKWACIAGVSYLIVFWLNYVTQWLGTFIQPESYVFAYPGYGINYVLDHSLNMFSFLLTSVGLLLLTIFFSWSVLPTIRDPATGPNLRWVGTTLTFLGGYFITIILLFVVFGPVGGRSIWITFFMYHNVDLWCVALPALGIPLILGKRPLT